LDLCDAVTAVGWKPSRQLNISKVSDPQIGQ
jgi:hypothetical protein